MIAETFGVIAANFTALRAESAAVAGAAEAMTGSLKAGGKILLCGNGGSAGDAQHLAAELVGRYKRERAAIAAIALTTDSSALTAIANDYAFDQVFSRQVEALGRAGDVLVAISTSGKSPNVVNAAQTALARGLTVIALTGARESPLSASATIAIRVPATDTARIQEMHIAVGHVLCGLIEDSLV